MKTKNHLLRFIFILCISLILGTAQVFADLLIFQSSDNHSEYANIPNYLKTTSARAQDFWQQHPGEPVIHLLNGDLTGPSPLTLLHGGEDRGYLNLEVFGNLNHRYLTIMNSGNHDAFDYQGELGIRLFLKQTQDFLTLANAGGNSIPIRITTANIVPSEEAKQLYQPYQEITSPSGRKIRVVGILLQDFYAYTTYDSLHNTTIHAFTAVRPMLEVAKEQLLKAAADGVHSVIFMYHEQFQTVQENIQQLLAWKSQEEKANPALATVEVPLVFAGHDHEVRTGKVGSTDIIDSGSAYAFSEVRLDDNGRLKSLTHWDTEKQKQNANFTHLFPEEQKSLQAVEAYILEAQIKGNEVITAADGRPYLSPGIDDTRAELKKARRPLGDLITNVLLHWAHDELIAAGSTIPPIKGVLAFYNSGSYRNGKAIPAGPITRAMAIAPYPMPGPARIILLSGRHVQAMYASLRDFGISKNEYTPQLPSIVREKSGDSAHTLELQQPDGSWATLDPEGTYALGLEIWLGMNGFKIPEFDNAFAQAKDVPLRQAIFNETLLKYFPAHLDKFPSCELNLVHQ